MADNSRAVFLSDASQDAEAAQRICEALRGEPAFQRLMAKAEARATAQPQAKK